LQHVSVKMVKSAWAGDVRLACSRAGWTGTPPHAPPPGSQACLRVVPLLQTLMAGLDSTPLHTATRRPQHDGGTPWSEPADLRVGCRGCGWVSCPVVCQNGDGGGSWAGVWWASWSELVVWCCSVSSVRSSPSAQVTWYPYQTLRRLNLPPCQCRWESQQCMASLPINPPMRLAGFLTPPERRKPEKHVSERHPLCFSECGRALRSSGRTRLQGLESAATHASCPCCTQRASLCRRAGAVVGWQHSPGLNHGLDHLKNTIN
jgi:hypothetical protein